ncbi:MAG: primosomal protein N' [Candidatus Eisenbacteria bacterium]
MYVVVAVPVPARREFTYLLPGGSPNRRLVGRRALVPFGRRKLTGVIVAVTPLPPPVEAKEILEILDEEPVAGPAILELTKWISEYYLSSWGETLRAALPIGRAKRSRRHVFATGTEGGPPAEGFDAEALRHVALGRSLPVTLLARRLGAPPAKVEGALKRLAAAGLVEVRSILEREEARDVSETWLEILPEGRRDGVEETLRKNAVRQIELLLLLRHKGRMRRASLGRFGSAVEALEKRGLVRRVEEEITRIDSSAFPESSDPDPPLTDAQESALAPVVECIREGRFETHLIHGVTGSGKTEVYLRAALAARELGKSVLVLVPEIALTPQTVARFRARFGEEAVVLHSGLSAGERHDTWREIHRGTFPVVVGVRSALFAPLGNLGLVVVDEEHDGSYKQGESPRYHARDGAVVRGRLEKVPVLLGSATPSVESYWNAKNGKYRLALLPRRIGNRPLPRIEMLDLHTVPPKERIGVLSPLLVERIARTLERGEQAMIFLNRRGFAPYLHCPDCGHVPRCSHCEVTFTYHSGRPVLRCHYCGTERRPPDDCPECGGHRITHRGVGTQRVEEDLRGAFPSARVARMDLDTTRRRDAARKILRDFAEGKVDILLGTQMIAKGHHFPGVSVVGVVNADTALHLPDFRAAEKTLQLLLQVSGRAGRGDREGEVVVQTFHPDHYSLKAAANHDYEMFVERELRDRKELGYPPFSRIVSITFRGKKAGNVRGAATRFRLRLNEDKRVAPLVREILGPAPAPIAKIRDLVRWKLILKGRSERWRSLRLVLGEHVEAFRARPGGPRADIIVDVDAYDLL